MKSNEEVMEKLSEIFEYGDDSNYRLGRTFTLLNSYLDYDFITKEQAFDIIDYVYSHYC